MINLDIMKEIEESIRIQKKHIANALANIGRLETFLFLYTKDINDRNEKNVPKEVLGALKNGKEK